MAITRAVVPGQFGDEAIFKPIEPQFARYPKSSFEFVAGKAESLDPDARQLTVTTNAGNSRTIAYDAVVIATGARARDGMPWKEVGTTEDTKNKLHAVQEQLRGAKSILVAGGGHTGIEMVAEIGFEFAQKGQKDVYFLTDKALPLNEDWREDIRKGIKSELEKLGIKHIPSTKVTAVKPEHSSPGRTTLELTEASGKTRQMTVDAYLPALGVEPNSEFMPAKLRDKAGYILQDESLRVPGYEDLFVIGDVGSLEATTVVKAEAQLVHLAREVIHPFLTGQGEPAKYKIDSTLVGAITLGRSRATGQYANWKLPSLMIWWMKGRHLGTDKAADYVAGKRTTGQTNW